jgi:FKBP-type peptidyl-prolyl cis-trans isomerase 2
MDMSQAKTGDTVQVHYTGRLSDGSQFDSSDGREPIQFEVGQGQVIPGFENEVVGLSVGDTKTFTIPAAEAYGLHREDWVVKVPRDQMPAQLELEEGRQLQVKQESGDVAVVTITGLTETEVTLDANHPLAGQDLTFDIELVAIV